MQQNLISLKKWFLRGGLVVGTLLFLTSCDGVIFSGEGFTSDRGEGVAPGDIVTFTVELDIVLPGSNDIATSGQTFRILGTMNDEENARLIDDSITLTVQDAGVAETTTISMASCGDHVCATLIKPSRSDDEASITFQYQVAEDIPENVSELSITVQLLIQREIEVEYSDETEEPIIISTTGQAVQNSASLTIPVLQEGGGYDVTANDSPIENDGLIELDNESTNTFTFSNNYRETPLTFTALLGETELVTQTVQPSDFVDFEVLCEGITQEELDIVVTDEEDIGITVVCQAESATYTVFNAIDGTSIDGDTTLEVTSDPVGFTIQSDGPAALENLVASQSFAAETDATSTSVSAESLAVGETLAFNPTCDADFSVTVSADNADPTTFDVICATETVNYAVLDVTDEAVINNGQQLSARDSVSFWVENQSTTTLIAEALTITNEIGEAATAAFLDVPAGERQLYNIGCIYDVMMMSLSFVNAPPTEFVVFCNDTPELDLFFQGTPVSEGQTVNIQPTANNRFTYTSNQLGSLAPIIQLIAGGNAQDVISLADQTHNEPSGEGSFDIACLASAAGNYTAQITLNSTFSFEVLCTVELEERTDDGIGIPPLGEPDDGAPDENEENVIVLPPPTTPVPPNPTCTVSAVACTATTITVNVCNGLFPSATDLSMLPGGIFCSVVGTNGTLTFACGADPSGLNLGGVVITGDPGGESTTITNNFMCP